MKFERKGPNGEITEIEGKVRIEAGPVRKRATATEELLSDAVTAGHYKVGQPDAMGKPIKLGEPMDYIDWLSETRAFYVYTLNTKTQRWELADTCQSHEDALTKGTDLAAA